MGKKKVGDAFSLGPGRILLVTLSMQRWWLGAVVAVLWPLSSWDLLAWTEEGQFCWQIVEHTAAAAQAEYASCCLGWFLERLIRFFLGGPGNNYRRRQWHPHSSTLAWKIPWAEETGRLQSMGSLRVGNN